MNRTGPSILRGALLLLLSAIPCILFTLLLRQLELFLHFRVAPSSSSSSIFLPASGIIMDGATLYVAGMYGFQAVGSRLVVVGFEFPLPRAVVAASCALCVPELAALAVAACVVTGPWWMIAVGTVVLMPSNLIHWSAVQPDSTPAGRRAFRAVLTAAIGSLSEGMFKLFFVVSAAALSLQSGGSWLQWLVMIGLRCGSLAAEQLGIVYVGSIVEAEMGSHASLAALPRPLPAEPVVSTENVEAAQGDGGGVGGGGGATAAATAAALVARATQLKGLGAGDAEAVGAAMRKGATVSTPTLALAGANEGSARAFRLMMGTLSSFTLMMTMQPTVSVLRIPPERSDVFAGFAVLLLSRRAAADLAFLVWAVAVDGRRRRRPVWARVRRSFFRLRNAYVMLHDAIAEKASFVVAGAVTVTFFCGDAPWAESVARECREGPVMAARVVVVVARAVALTVGSLGLDVAGAVHQVWLRRRRRRRVDVSPDEPLRAAGGGSGSGNDRAYFDDNDDDDDEDESMIDGIGGFMTTTAALGISFYCGYAVLSYLAYLRGFFGNPCPLA
ncbi:hypothetical protein DFJ73DRAFT_908990 [Zopfochytrium polystomum]|nr:hypothetical protein DFJ73DRAFT_908990 [Zopfochytrium polystomum]